MLAYQAEEFDDSALDDGEPLEMHLSYTPHVAILVPLYMQLMAYKSCFMLSMDGW
jgi:hypothetical protein